MPGHYRGRLLPTLALAVFAGLIPLSQPAHAADDVWKVDGKLIGEAKDNGDFRRAEDVSGIACTTDRGFPRTCLVIDDEAQGAQFITLNEGRITVGTYLPLTSASFRGEPLELDGEAVAFWKDAFYVMGSHGRARNKKSKLDAEEMLAREIATAQLYRIKVDPRTLTAGIEPAPKPDLPSTRLKTLLCADKRLMRSCNAASEKNGLTLEGMAIREGRLFAGLRGPMAGKDMAAVFSVNLEALFGQVPPEQRLTMLTLGEGRGIRDLVALPMGYLVLAGPSDDPPEDKQVRTGDYTVFFWDGGTAAVRSLGDLKGYQEGKRPLKPEALLPLDRKDGKLRLLVMFDGATDGGARTVEVIAP